MSDVTQLLKEVVAGQPHAAAELLPLVYDELRRLAAQRLSHEPLGQTLQPTALVHEAYLRLAGADAEQRWDTRGHFFAAAAEAMRRILVENARRKHRLKRGGNRQRIDLQQAEVMTTVPSDDLLAIDEALNHLATEDPQKAEVVKLRFFTGLSVEETAKCLGISRATADRYWAYARAWLYNHLHSADDEKNSSEKS